MHASHRLLYNAIAPNGGKGWFEFILSVEHSKCIQWSCLSSHSEWNSIQFSTVKYETAKVSFYLPKRRRSKPVDRHQWYQSNTSTSVLCRSETHSKSHILTSNYQACQERVTISVWAKLYPWLMSYVGKKCWLSISAPNY